MNLWQIVRKMKQYQKQKKEKLKGQAWRNRAKEAFKRDNWTCQYTGKQYSEFNHALHPHHRVFKSQGGDDSFDNIASCSWEKHSNHGSLKNARLLNEHDDSKINELMFRYRS